MTVPTRVIFRLLAACQFGFTLPALAQAPLIHMSMDSLSAPNSGSLGGEAVLVTAEGESGVELVGGKLGSAIYFKGGAVLGIQTEFNTTRYPGLTATAWVKLDEGDAFRDSSRIIQANARGGAHFYLSARRIGVAARAPGGQAVGTTADRTVPRKEWLFMATVADLDNKTLKVYLNGQELKNHGLRDFSKSEVILYSNPQDAGAETSPWVFIGGPHFDRQPASGIAIDDVRVFGTALSEEQLAAVYRSTPSGTASSSDPTAGTGPVGEAGPSSSGEDLDRYESPAAEFERARQEATDRRSIVGPAVTAGSADKEAGGGRNAAESANERELPPVYRFRPEDGQQALPGDQFQPGADRNVSPHEIDVTPLGKLQTESEINNAFNPDDPAGVNGPSSE